MIRSVHLPQSAGLLAWDTSFLTDVGVKKPVEDCSLCYPFPQFYQLSSMEQRKQYTFYSVFFASLLLYRPLPYNTASMIRSTIHQPSVKALCAGSLWMAKLHMLRQKWKSYTETFFKKRPRLVSENAACPQRPVDQSHISDSPRKPLPYPQPRRHSHPWSTPGMVAKPRERSHPWLKCYLEKHEKINK